MATAESTSSPMRTSLRTATVGTGAFGLVATAAIGTYAWGSPIGTLGLLLLPMVLNLLPTRRWAYLVGLVYFATANIELPGIMVRFFPDASGIARFAAPAALTLIQALPFWLYHSRGTPTERAARMAILLLALTLPPIGWLAWCNPLLLAGLLFPGLGFAGLLGALALFAALAAGARAFDREQRGIIVVAAVAVIVSFSAMSKTSPIPLTAQGWIGIDTSLPPPDRRDPTKVRPKVPGAILAEATRAHMGDHAEVLVFPESVLDPMAPADEVAFMGAKVAAQRNGTIVLAGAIEKTGPDTWRNTIRAFGAMEGVIDESRLPMPLGNWRPGFGGVAGRPFATDLVTLKTRSGPTTAAMSICFEDTVIWPHAGLLSGQADVMVSVANTWATAGTRGDRTQTVSAHLLARLAGVPLVRARNVWEGER